MESDMELDMELGKASKSCLKRSLRIAVLNFAYSAWGDETRRALDLDGLREIDHEFVERVEATVAAYEKLSDYCKGKVER